jgi:hypothetical protein
MGLRREELDPETSRQADVNRTLKKFRVELDARRAAFQVWIHHPIYDVNDGLSTNNADDPWLISHDPELWCEVGQAWPVRMDDAIPLVGGARRRGSTLPSQSPMDGGQHFLVSHTIMGPAKGSLAATNPTASDIALHLRVHIAALSRAPSPSAYIEHIFARAGPEHDLALWLLNAVEGALPPGELREVFADALCAATETRTFRLVVRDTIIQKHLLAVSVHFGSASNRILLQSP